ncbi:forkhead box protein P1-like [Mercenaria mercenaria]|uniref:forkhead box protein P1-like n=1 Tax=Mercenaria mercenaria TaxID=6596 RepID=UPI00234E76D4|nr:forkhead box protein P1-like [Mercenaria mercenaria]
MNSFHNIIIQINNRSDHLSMEYCQGLQFKSEQELKNRCFKENFNYSETDQFNVNGKQQFQNKAVCLKSNVESSKEKFQNLPSVHLKTNGFERSSKFNKYSAKNVENGNMKRLDWESNSDEELMEGSKDLGKHVIRNEYRFMNERGLRQSRPDMTRSLSCNVDRDVRISHWPQDKYMRSYSCAPQQYDVLMAAEEEGAMNLSAEGKQGKDEGTGEAGNSHVNSPSGVTNGETEQLSQGLASPQEDVRSAGSLSRHKPRSSDERSPDLDLSAGSSQHQSLLMLAAQHGLSPQQLQQMLMVQQGATAPPHLQQLLQAQQSVVMQQQQKVQEQALVQLNEQLQLNLLQQSQLVQDKKTNGKQTQQQLQHLAVQQQQIVQQIQQIQLQQRQLLLACLMQPYTAQQGIVSPVDMHQAWKELATSQGTSDDHLKSALPNGTNIGALNGSGLGISPLVQGSLLGLNGMTQDTFPIGAMIGQSAASIKSEEGFSPLYRHGVCKWPGCDTECSDMTSFTKHLCAEHTLDDKNTAQARVQMQIVSQLEIQLTREKELLHAMMQHLHTQPQRKNQETIDHKASEKIISSSKVPSSIVSPIKTISAGNNSLPVLQPKKSSTMPQLSTTNSGLAPLVIPPQSSLSSVTSAGPGSLLSQSTPSTPTGGLGPMRRRVSDKCNLPISTEIQRNRDFYKSTDVRPPFTYASLIRQAIIESENKQLTLNEVYQWFQNTFAYFRRNEATWKNAVRHNLSLHKCFMRVENVKGAVWTVDEVEFYKRRPQKLTGAIPSSPSFASDGGIYGDPINASIRVAMEQNSMLMNHQTSNGSMMEGVEDLSMKSFNNSNDSFVKSESPQRDDMMYMRPDSLTYQQDSMNSSPQDYSSQGLDLSPKSSQNSPKGQLGSSLAYSGASEQSRLQSQESDLSESTNGRFVNSSEEHYLHHQEHYSRQSDESVTNQAGLDMQISSILPNRS